MYEQEKAGSSWNGIEVQKGEYKPQAVLPRKWGDTTRQDASRQTGQVKRGNLLPHRCHRCRERRWVA